MITFAVDGQNDLFLDQNGGMALAIDADALAQAAAQFVRTLRGELVFDALRGMPNLDTVWRGVPNLPQYEAALRQRLLAVEGVQAILSLQSERQGEVFSYRAELRTIYGAVTVNG